MDINIGSLLHFIELERSSIQLPFQRCFVFVLDILLLWSLIQSPSSLYSHLALARSLQSLNSVKYLQIVNMNKLDLDYSSLSLKSKVSVDKVDA